MSLRDWEPVALLGEGGQGEVHKARSSAATSKRGEQKASIVGFLNRPVTNPTIDIEAFTRSIGQLIEPEPATNFGALKQFKLPNEPSEKAKAISRLAGEIEALKSIDHPSLVRLLDSSDDSTEPFLVTEYHPNGSLDKRLSDFKGRPLEAVMAFRPLVDAVVHIHEKQFIHRDIKTKNIFVATDGRLVLGDFGIVFFLDGRPDRVTTTFERVGTRDWMAPWAHRNLRLELEKVNPTLDIFPLAKVLWSMISGDDGFSAWDWDHKETDLRRRFPRDLLIEDISNLIFAKCIVRDSDDCFPNVKELRNQVDKLIGKYSHAPERPIGAMRWRCRICETGMYKPHRGTVQTRLDERQHQDDGTERILRFVCDYCSHLEYFLMGGKLEATSPPPGGGGHP